MSKTPASSRDHKGSMDSFGSSTTEDSFISMEPRGQAVNHPVAMSDRQLYRVAAATGRSIKWDTIARQAQSEAARWKWLEDSRDFAIYVRDMPENYAVFATGAIPCSVAELVDVVDATTAKQHHQKMGAFHGGQFKGGAHVYTVDLKNDRMREVIESSGYHGTPITDLMVKTATFTRTNWLHRHEEWCYLAVMRRHPNNERFEKQMTALEPKDLIVGKSDSRTKFLHDFYSAVLFEPETSDESEPTAQRTRVHFYAEYAPPTSIRQLPVSRGLACDKTVKQRLLMMAQGSDRFGQLIRRRRLGVQVLIDQMRVLPSTNAHCLRCTTPLMLAKLCRVCGQGVCSSCSQKHEREVLVRGGTQTRLEGVRVCDRCTTRVDEADYTCVSDRSLMGAIVFPDAKGDKSADETLKELLKHALLNAPSQEMQKPVMSVIKSVLDASYQYYAGSRHASVKRLTETSSVNEYLTALDRLNVPQVPHNLVDLAAANGRTYVMNQNTANERRQYPVPANEADRLCAIAASDALAIGHSQELNLISELAAQALGAIAGLVTIVTNTDKHVIGTNVEALKNARFPRSEAFCAHAIMEDKPLIVPHPEADVRFHRTWLVQNMGVRYYCGFPLLAEDNKTVIGALCCVDNKTHDMTESQYAALSKLAQTASKVMRAQGKQRRESSAA